MEDPDGALSFDFEGGLDVAPDASICAPSAGSLAPSDHIDAAAVTGAMPPNLAGGVPADGYGRRNFRKTVCRHWLRGLCMRGDACGYLHQYDKDRMPVCRFFRLDGGCRKQDCLYKHITADIKECNMHLARACDGICNRYKLGFCPNGPDCRYRHAKHPGPPPPVEEVFQKMQQLNSQLWFFKISSTEKQ